MTSKTKVIEVVKQDIGETVWYPAQKMHGVSLVKKGYRLVLISWYKDNEKDQVYKETI
jgi:predicted 2-oxoglutarate/Fe(II)-dependent dioxygenase YbiX